LTGQGGYPTDLKRKGEAEALAYGQVLAEEGEKKETREGAAGPTAESTAIGLG